MPSFCLTMCMVNYSPLKREACPWRYAAEGASETFGGLTAARPRRPGRWRTGPASWTRPKVWAGDGAQGRSLAGVVLPEADLTGALSAPEAD